MRKLYVASALVVVAELLCAWIFGSQLWHFHEHAWYFQALNSAGLPLALYTVFRSVRLTWQIHQDEKEHVARMQALHARHEALHEQRRKTHEDARLWEIREEHEARLRTIRDPRPDEPFLMDDEGDK